MIECPCCKQTCISLGEKYKLGIWKTVHCRQCGAKLTAHPIALALVDFVYVWNVSWFGVLAYIEKDMNYLLYLVIGWLVVDIINLMVVPLAILSRKKEA